MNKRTFDLILLESMLVFGVMGGLARMWSTRRLQDGPPSGVLHGTAVVVKGLTG